MAMNFMAALLTSPVANKYSQEQIAMVAVSSADALIEQLKKPVFNTPTETPSIIQEG
jgi:hypothetical protein